MLGSRLGGPMQADTLPIPIIDLAPPLPRPPIQWRRASRVLRELLREPDATEKVFELIEAMGGRGDEQTVQNFVRQPEGRRLLAEKPSLLAHLADREALAALPAGSFGRAYVAFSLENGFAVDGILDAKARGADLDAGVDPDRRWFWERLNLAHDLWHVLTGYGTDPAGEVALLSFSRAQGVANRTLQLLQLASLFEGLRSGGPPFVRFVREARRRGLQAAPLLVQRYEELLPLPLEEVRRTLSIRPLAEAHPAGVFRADGALRRLDRLAA